MDGTWRNVNQRSRPESHVLLVAHQERKLPFEHIEKMLELPMHMWVRAGRTRLDHDLDHVVVAGRSRAHCLEHDAAPWNLNPFPFFWREHTTCRHLD
jgi:hypothetical protein